MAALLGALVELGYGVGYRVLDARYFGVPQRRRRVFILGDSLGGRAGAERASEVLSVGSRCRWHPPTGLGERPGPAPRAVPGVDIARAVTGSSGKRHDDDDDTDTLIPATVGTLNDLAHHGWTANAQSVAQGHVIPAYAPDADAVRRAERPSPDADRVRATDGLAGRLDDHGLAATLNSGGNNGGFRTEPGEHLVTAFAQNQRGELRTSDTAFQLTTGGGKPGEGYSAVYGGPSGVSDDPLLPLGLDSHRYRCCGNGVVSDVAEWIGYRLAALA